MSIVLSVEGQAYTNRRLWSTHKVLGVFETKEEAIQAVKDIAAADEDGDVFCDETIVLLTDTKTTAIRLTQDELGFTDEQKDKWRKARDEDDSDQEDIRV